MPNEGEEFDGSELEQSQTQEQVTVAPSAEQVVTPTEQPAQETAQPPQLNNIPEQYRGLTPEQLVHELQKKDSTLGRYKAEVGTLRQARNYPSPVYNQQIQAPSSLPGYEAPGLRQGQQQVNLNEKYWESPVDVLAQVVEQKVNQGIQTYEQQQLLRNQQAAMSRAQWITTIDDDELQNLRLDESINYTPEHEALMESLAKRDPEILQKLRDPNITEQGIRDAVRGMFAKADRILKGQLQDPEKIKALTAAQKQAAANGSPLARASASAQSSSPLEERATEHLKQRGWGFLDSR